MTQIQIIYLNGPSSSGKTTLAKELQQESSDFFLHISVDKIIGWMPEKANDWTGKKNTEGYSWKESIDIFGVKIQELQIGPYAQTISRSFQEIALMLAKMSHKLIIEDFSFGKLEEWKLLLKEYRVLWARVHAPLAILEEREKKRGNRIIGSARAQFHTIPSDAYYDLDIDTYHQSLKENVKKILFYPYKTDYLIRTLQETDLVKIIEHYTFPWSTPEKTKALWEKYYEEQSASIRTVAVIEKEKEIVGYGSFLRKSQYSFFLKNNIPEIQDLWIDEKYRKLGFATALIHWMETLAIEEGYAKIGIGVGLYKDYGPAQKLYFQLGYLPDGKGISYQNEKMEAGKKYPLDDDLLLWLIKEIRR